MAANLNCGSHPGLHRYDVPAPVYRGPRPDFGLRLPGSEDRHSFGLPLVNVSGAC